MNSANSVKRSEKIGNDRKSSGAFLTSRHNDDRYRMYPVFSEMHPKLFIISDLNRPLTDIAEVHYTPFYLKL